MAIMMSDLSSYVIWEKFNELTEGENDNERKGWIYFFFENKSIIKKCVGYFNKN